MKKISVIMFFICLFALPIAAMQNSDIPEPYASIVDLPFDAQGWFVNEKPLRKLISKHRPKIVIEIGSWLGCSTRFIASELQNNGILYAVDTWQGSQNEATHMNDSRLPFLYQLFLSNVKQAGLTNKIIPIRMESLEAANALNIIADFIYIDASHDTESVKNDIFAWYPHLSKKGVLCGDDWKWNSVREAVLYCAKVLNKRVCSDGNCWWFE